MSYQRRAARLYSPFMSTDAWTVKDLLAWTREFFARRGVDSPRLCAEILLADALGCTRIELYTRPETVPGEDTRGRFREQVRKAGDGTPIAYLIGRKEFFSLEFAVSPAVLIPRPETEILVERAIDLLKRSEGRMTRVLDVGTGSGCIIVALARHRPEIVAHASDISAEALAVARKNAATHAVDARIEFREGDLLAPWADAPPFDLIVSNPPYIGETERDTLSPTVRDFEPSSALFAGPDGLAVIRRLLEQARSRLAPGGQLLFEIAWNQAAAVREVLDAAGWQHLTTYRDGLGHERVAHAQLRDSAAARVA